MKNKIPIVDHLLRNEQAITEAISELGVLIKDMTESGLDAVHPATKLNEWSLAINLLEERIEALEHLPRTGLVS